MKSVPGWIIAFIITGLVSLGGLGFWYWGTPSGSVRPHAIPVEKITLSTSPDTKSALIFIARDKGYFSANGLEVTVKMFPSGKLGYEQLKAGNVDIANIADFVLVDQVFQGVGFLRCLGAIARADDHSLIFLKDQGILTPADLRGKKIGAPRGTSAEFFLGRFLVFNNLGLKDVEYIDVQPSALEAALTTHKVDAILTWEQWAESIRQHLGEKISWWPGQSGQKYYWLLVSTDVLAASRPEVPVRLFRALEQAEKFLQSHPKEAIGIIAQQINVDPAVVEAARMKSTYALSLDQALLITMEDEARWMIGNKLTDKNRVPNFLPYLHGESLARVKSQAVDIIFPKNQK